jgi:N-acyl-D-aspartate/D-glutamate deacylase
VSDLDLVIRGARVVDGSGLPPFSADVAIRGERIAQVGRVGARGQRELDADGCVLAPGFIDIHTHYDAQLHFEPTASPSSWHGVATVIGGNCGFSLFPAKREDVPWLLNMLSRVEGMSAATLAAGVHFAGGGCADFARGFEAKLGVNLGLQVGHSALRRQVLGGAANERAAEPGEIRSMQALLRAALHEGAVGFSSSQLAMHVDHDGAPVPSNLAEPGELIALAEVLAEFPHGVIQFISGSNLEGHSEADRALMRAMCRASGKPLNVNPLVHLPHVASGWKRGLEFAEGANAEGLRILPQSSLQQMQVFFALRDTFLFDEMPAWKTALTAGSGREAMLRDPAHRKELRAQFDHKQGRAITFDWESVRLVRSKRFAEWIGTSVPEIARARGRGDALDAFLDCSLDEDLASVFCLASAPSARSRAAQVEVLRSASTLPGSSDAGAHLTSYCGADFSTRLLCDYVPEVLSLPEAVRRLSTIPAALYGFADRGAVRSGAVADLVIWDPAALGVGATRWLEDFPAGGGRFAVESRGYRALIVNGGIVREDDRDTGSRPGRVLRPSG